MAAQMAELKALQEKKRLAAEAKEKAEADEGNLDPKEEFADRQPDLGIEEGKEEEIEVMDDGEEEVDDFQSDNATVMAKNTGSMIGENRNDLFKSNMSRG